MPEGLRNTLTIMDAVIMELLERVFTYIQVFIPVFAIIVSIVVFKIAVK